MLRLLSLLVFFLFLFSSVSALALDRACSQCNQEDQGPSVCAANGQDYKSKCEAEVCAGVRTVTIERF